MASDSATLRRLLRSGETKAVHERLRSVGMTKLGDRLRAIGTLTLEAGAEEDIVPVALPSARGLTAMLPRPRVAFVCHTGYFSGGFGGATRASLSMIREARRICGSADGGGGLDVIALVQKPVPEALVFKLEDGRLGELDWEGERVLVGRDDVLAGALADRAYDVVLSFSIECTLLRFALRLRATRYFATPHNYYMPPFGPFKRFEVQDGHHELLQRMDALLSPCKHHCAYMDRWGPGGLTLRPLYAADYRYFHSVRPAGAAEARLPDAMAPWERGHRYVTMVSPSPEKGLAILSTLSRRLPRVAFAAVATQWTGGDTLAQLRTLPNVTVLQADPDVDVIFRQTRVLLAPSLWQECCPLIVMEACLRGIPCVSSDVFGLPEANCNQNLIAHASLSFDHARGRLCHGLSNAQLEQTLGPNPPLPTPAERADAVRAATRAEATAEEVAPFEALLVPLWKDDGMLRREAQLCRDKFLAFAESHADGLSDELYAAVACRRGPMPSPPPPSPQPALLDGASVSGVSVSGACVSGAADDRERVHAVDAVRSLGHGIASISISDVKQRRGRADEPSPADANADGSGGPAAADELLQLLPTPVAYRVVHSPFIFLRKAPAVDAEVLTVLQTGQTFEVDAVRNGWARTAKKHAMLTGQPGGAAHIGWGLLHGGSLGLGTLLAPLDS